METTGRFSNILKIRPPLAFNQENVDQALDAMDSVFLFFNQPLAAFLSRSRPPRTINHRQYPLKMSQLFHCLLKDIHGLQITPKKLVVSCYPAAANLYLYL